MSKLQDLSQMLYFMNETSLFLQRLKQAKAQEFVNNFSFVSEGIDPGRVINELIECTRLLHSEKKLKVRIKNELRKDHSIKFDW